MVEEEGGTVKQQQEKEQLLVHVPDPLVLSAALDSLASGVEALRGGVAGADSSPLTVVLGAVDLAV